MENSLSLTVRGGGHTYGYRRIFSNVDLTLLPGEMLAITGENGSGKSTLLRILAGVLQPTKGEVELILDGQRIPRELHALNVGFVAPYVNVYEGLTLRENLAFIMRVRAMNEPMEHMESIVAEVGLSDWIDAQVGTYSTGMQQRVRFAAALLHRPRVLLLDEPMTGLDAKGRAVFEKAIFRVKEAGYLVAIASNSKDEIRLTNRTLCIEDYAPRSVAPVQSSGK
ncbi:MAG: ABC transporter ATP-binding protein [Bacteroidetes bacterium]|nr:ABC transporter ATP-binding protein [Bacteroidota bacterium]MXW82094.1 ABC transporter ATP-binding protein [Rhodothermaceae bacterium]MDE2671936.1 ABC transporter ATP-binding protein [Bacteroidota bacterium]MXX58803.1 ABC transporter ATP-binding protein [Rhodothermaceae bacterium]MXZ04140.1 ABC transporter ATP-binding protein [Rhodothermaceae bacterium]